MILRNEKKHAILVEWDSLQREFPQLQNWKLIINGRMTSAAGRCKFQKKELHLAKWHASRNALEDSIDTLRHEAAHALAGFEAGHGDLWKVWAIRVGARPNRTLPHEHWTRSPAAQRPPKWLVRCLSCGHEFKRKRRNRKRGSKLVCGVCHGELRWTELR